MESLQESLKEASRLASSGADPELALQKYKEVLVSALFSSGDSLSVQFICLKNIARIYYAQGNLTSSKNFMLRAYNLSKSLYTSLRDMTEIHISLCEMLSEIFHRLGDATEADRFLKESRELKVVPPRVFLRFQTSCLRRDGLSDMQIEEFWRLHPSVSLESNASSLDGGGSSPMTLESEAVAPPVASSVAGGAQSVESRSGERNRKSQSKEESSAASGVARRPGKSSKSASSKKPLEDYGDLAKATDHMCQFSKRGKLSSLKDLLETPGVDPNAVHAITHYTALHYACWHGRKEIVTYLLSKGADPRIQNGEKETALETARKANQTEIVDLLEEHLRLHPPNVPSLPAASPSESIAPASREDAVPLPSTLPDVEAQREGDDATEKRSVGSLDEELDHALAYLRERQGAVAVFSVGWRRLLK